MIQGWTSILRSFSDTKTLKAQQNLEGKVQFKSCQNIMIIDCQNAYTFQKIHYYFWQSILGPINYADMGHTFQKNLLINFSQ